MRQLIEDNLPAITTGRSMLGSPHRRGSISHGFTCSARSTAPLVDGIMASSSIPSTRPVDYHDLQLVDGGSWRARVAWRWIRAWISSAVNAAHAGVTPRVADLDILDADD
jgi:hypothetical protein